MSDDATRRILESELERLQAENERLQRQVERPIPITVQSPDSGALKQIEQYLPQLTHIATNLSYVASALQGLGGVNLSGVESKLERIATALEGIEDKP